MARALIVAAMAKGIDRKLAASEQKRMIGRNLRLARETLGHSQSAFAKLYGVSPNRWNQWETGLYYPDPCVLAQICQDYGFSMDWFYRGVLAGVSFGRAVDLRKVDAGK